MMVWIYPSFFYYSCPWQLAKRSGKTDSQRNVPQTKPGQYGIPQRVNLPKESINVRENFVYLREYKCLFR